MLNKHFPEEINNILDIITNDHERSSSALEFVVILESVKYLDFVNVHSETTFGDVIKKLELMGLPNYLIREFKDYKRKRNGICHNSKIFMAQFNDKDYYKEYSLLAANLVHLTVEYVDNNYINFEHVERKYFRYLESKGRPIPENEKKYYMKKASKLSRSHIFTK